MLLENYIKLLLKHSDNVITITIQRGLQMSQNVPCMAMSVQSKCLRTVFSESLQSPQENVLNLYAEEEFRTHTRKLERFEEHLESDLNSELVTAC